MTRQFNPSDSGYVEVAERIAEFRKTYPDGVLQSDVVAWPSEAVPFVTVKAFAYRTPDDVRPGTGLAWEPFPGRTPYTKDSEVQNAETSAWGRAIVAVGAADTKRGIASANEVRNRSDAPTPPRRDQKADSGSPARQPESATTSTGGTVREGGSSGGDLLHQCGGTFLPMVSKPGWLECSKCRAQRKEHP